MRSGEAAKRLREMAALLDELGPDGQVLVMRVCHDKIDDQRTMIFRVALAESKRHYVLADKFMKIAHALEPETDRQAALPYFESESEFALMQHLKRK